MQYNKEIKEAMNELEKISEDEELRMIAELREKAIRDEQNGLRHAREDGRKEGLKEGKVDIARKMLEKNMDIDTICELTGLERKEILKLK